MFRVKTMWEKEKEHAQGMGWKPELPCIDTGGYSIGYGTADEMLCGKCATERMLEGDDPSSAIFPFEIPDWYSVLYPDIGDSELVCDACYHILQYEWADDKDDPDEYPCPCKRCKAEREGKDNA